MDGVGQASRQQLNNGLRDLHRQMNAGGISWGFDDFASLMSSLFEIDRSGAAQIWRVRDIPDEFFSSQASVNLLLLITILRGISRGIGIGGVKELPALLLEVRRMDMEKSRVKITGLPGYESVGVTEERSATSLHARAQAEVSAEEEKEIKPTISVGGQGGWYGRGGSKGGGNNPHLTENQREKYEGRGDEAYEDSELFGGLHYIEPPQLTEEEVRRMEIVREKKR